jgi:hypothetical protein
MDGTIFINSEDDAMEPYLSTVMELLRLHRWLDNQDWAREYYDRDFIYHIFYEGISDYEVIQILNENNFGNINNLIIQLHGQSKGGVLMRV